MELLHINGTLGKKRCSIQISSMEFMIEGDFYHLINKEFYSTRNGRDTCNIKEYMGLGSLRKRSPRKMLQFVAVACILEMINIVAGKIGDYLFFINTDWVSYIVNVTAILCAIQGVRLFFSRKEVIEISFLSKRFCVDKGIFQDRDMDLLHQMLLKLR